MALTEQVLLDISSAQRQIDQLDQQLATLSQPINVPVTVSGDNQLAGVRQDLALSENAVDQLNRELNETDDALRDVGRAADRTGTDLEQAGRRGRGAFDGMGRAVLGFATALGAVQGARAFLDFAGDAIDAASDLEESTSKAQVVFGDFFGEIEAFASTAPQALGLANSAALEFTGTFGNLFVALGLSQQAAAELAPEIVQLGADLASFNNLEVTDALDKLRAGLVGEAEPLRSLGVNINAAAVSAKALELGLAGASGEISEAAKVQARYALILEQTSTAQGDFARTADGIANRQRTLAGEFENLRATVGGALLPAFEAILDVAPSLITLVEDGLVPALASLGTAIGGIDTDGLARNLAGLPSAVGSTFSLFDSGVGSIVNATQALNSLITLDFEGFGQNFRELGDDIQRFRAAPVANQALQDLLTTIQGGRDPVLALESVLKELGAEVDTLTVDQFAGLTDQLLAIVATTDPASTDLISLARTVRQFGEDAGFSSAGVEILVEALLALASEGLDIGPNFARAGRGIRDLGDDVAATEPILTDFGESVSRLVSQDFDFNVDSIRDSLAQLPDIFSGTAEALKDEEGEIIEDFAEFLDNFDDVLTARRDFQRNIAFLRALGLDNLAAIFEDAGIDAAPALQDGIDQGVAALVAQESQFQRLADQNAQDYVTGFGTSVGERLANLSPDVFEVDAEIEVPAELVLDQPDDSIQTQADELFDPATLAAFLEINQAEDAIQRQADSLFPPSELDALLELDQSTDDIQRQADSLFGPIILPATITATALNIPDSFFNINVGAGAPGSTGTTSSGGGGGGGAVNVYQNFYDRQTSSTSQTQAAQAVNSLIATGGPQ